MPDSYSNFQELQLNELEGQDYQIRVKGIGHSVLIIAPHGGKIEPFTSQIAQWIAGEEFAWYSFEGIKEEGKDNRILHITSHKYDEPTLLQALKQAKVVLTIHGLKDSSEEFLMIGGLDSELGQKLERTLQQSSFKIKSCEQKYRGIRATNICNRGCTGKGVQLEISYALRKRIIEDTECRNRFVDSIRSLLLAQISPRN
ncbi:MAG: poly-gamma-glutamate hydrolase family protein [Bacillota bacterium]|nr:poly-gamma-glutamate hydrolase family protein [Bacillota bacterium]